MGSSICPDKKCDDERTLSKKHIQVLAKPKSKHARVKSAHIGQTFNLVEVDGNEM